MPAGLIRLAARGRGVVLPGAHPLSCDHGAGALVEWPELLPQAEMRIG
jgi:hypothetical protein